MRNVVIMGNGHMGVSSIARTLEVMGSLLPGDVKLTPVRERLFNLETDYGEITEISLISSGTIYWKEFLQGRRFDEIIVGESFFKSLDKESVNLILSRLAENEPTPTYSWLFRQARNVGFFERFVPVFGEGKGREESWVEGKDMPVGKFKKGMFEFFMDLDNPTDEEYKTAIFALGG